mgnify:FL=1
MSVPRMPLEDCALRLQHLGRPIGAWNHFRNGTSELRITSMVPGPDPIAWEDIRDEKSTHPATMTLCSIFMARFLPSRVWCQNERKATDRSSEKRRRQVSKWLTSE